MTLFLLLFLFLFLFLFFFFLLLQKVPSFLFALLFIICYTLFGIPPLPSLGLRTYPLSLSLPTPPSARRWTMVKLGAGT